MAACHSIESTLARFARHLYAQRGLGEVAVHNYVSAIRCLALVIGIKPTLRVIERHVEQMYKSGASYSHIVNMSLALEAYCPFFGRSIKLGRPKKPRHLVRGILSESEITLLIAAARTLRERAMIATLAYAGLRTRNSAGCGSTTLIWVARRCISRPQRLKRIASRTSPHPV